MRNRTRFISIAIAISTAAFVQTAPAADHRDGLVILDASARALILVAPFDSEQEILWAATR